MHFGFGAFVQIGKWSKVWILSSLLWLYDLFIKKKEKSLIQSPKNIEEIQKYFTLKKWS